MYLYKSYKNEKPLLNTSINRQLYLCPPSFLEMSYEINPWMDKSKPFSKDVAAQQWNNLVSLYKTLVPNNVTVLEAKDGLTELCFFGDSVFAFNNTAVFSRFATNERFDETDYAISLCEKFGLKGQRVPENISFEGSGETMMWNDNILVGYGKRSSSEIVEYLKSVYNKPVYGLELVDSKYYHLDTALCPISNDLMLVYLPAFSEESKAQIEQFECEKIYVTEDDALSFALNSIVLGKDIIIHKDATHIQNILSEKGYNVHSLDISEFIKFGGGIKCLTFQHYLEADL